RREIISEFHGFAAGPAGLAGAASWCAGAVAFGGEPGAPGFAGVAGSPGFLAGTGSTEGGFGFPCESFGSPLGGGTGALVSSAMCGACPRSSRRHSGGTLTSNSLQTRCQRHGIRLGLCACTWGRRVPDPPARIEDPGLSSLILLNQISDPLRICF